MPEPPPTHQKNARRPEPRDDYVGESQSGTATQPHFAGFGPCRGGNETM
jgi:hypothetical protein